MSAENPVLKSHANSAFNVFVMTSFARYDYRRDRIRIGRYGYTALRADDQAISSELWAIVKHYMEASELEMAVFENSAQSELFSRLPDQAGAG